MRFRTAPMVVVVLTCSSALFIGGCGSDDDMDSAASALVGTWTRTFNGRPVTIVLKASGDYSVNMTGGVKADVKGRYTAQNDQVTFMDESGTAASTSGQALYGFAIDEDRLTLTPINEPDENRRSVAAATWTRDVK